MSSPQTEEKVPKKEPSTLKVVFNTIFYTLLVFITVSSFAIFVGPRLMGGGSLTILTGSMEPTISPGDLVVVLPYKDDSSPILGDIVTYHPNPDDPTLVTHRVEKIEIGVEGENEYITQGDANNTTDEPITKTQIVGKVRLIIPKLGYIPNFIQNIFR